MWHRFKENATQWGFRLMAGNWGMIFVGYGVPLWFGLKVVDPLDEIALVARMDIDVVIAFATFDFGGFLWALSHPFSVDPFWFALGRFGLAFCVAGAAVLIAIDFLNLLLLTLSVLRLRRRPPSIEPSEAIFEEPEDALRRMGHGAPSRTGGNHGRQSRLRRVLGDFWRYLSRDSDRSNGR